VEIDYCPQCRGIWLDRGEVDKIIEREMAAYGPLPAQQRQAAPHPEPFLRDDLPPEPFLRDDLPVERRDDERRDDERRDYSDDRRRYGDDDDRRRDDRGDDRDDRYRGKKKRESFLSDLLDF